MHLCQQKGTTPGGVAREAGLSRSTLQDWKNGRCVPKAETLLKIADYFGVSMEYLMTGKETEHEPYYRDPESREIADFLFKNPQYATLFKTVRDVPPEDLKMVQELLDRLIPKDDHYGA